MTEDSKPTLDPVDLSAALSDVDEGLRWIPTLRGTCRWRLFVSPLRSINAADPLSWLIMGLLAAILVLPGGLVWYYLGVPLSWSLGVSPPAVIVLWGLFAWRMYDGFGLPESMAEESEPAMMIWNINRHFELLKLLELQDAPLEFKKLRRLSADLVRLRMGLLKSQSEL